MRTSPIQESFQSGEIDPRIRGRTTIDAYKTGLKRAYNWRPLVQGPIVLREGSQFIEAVDPDNWVSGNVGVNGIRCFTFSRGLDNDAIIEVGETDIVLRNMDGSVIVGGVSGNLLPNPQYVGWDATGGNPPPCTVVSGVPNSIYDCATDADIAGTADPGRYNAQLPGGVANGPRDPCPTVSITGAFNFGLPEDNYISLSTQTGPQLPDLPYAAGVNDGWNSSAWENSAANPIIVPAGSDLLLNELTLDYDPRISATQVATLGGLPLTDIRIRVNVGTTKGASDVFSTTVAIGFTQTRQQTTISFIPGAGNNSLYLSIFLEWAGGAIVPDLVFDPILPTLYACSLYLYPLEWLVPLAGGSGGDVVFPAVWTAEQMECLQFCMDPGEQVGFFTHPEVETQRIRLAVGEWTLEALSAILLPTPFVPPSPNNWAPGNFPAACTFHEGRLWLGGSPVNPATLWASRSGDYADFGNAAPASADDPLLFPLSSSGNIQTLTSRKELVVNTDISEVIGTSVQGVISFDDFSFPKQTDWGANCIQPMVIGRDMVYTSNSRQRVRTFADEGGTNYGWDGNELSLLARDIFGSPVRRMIYLDEPAYQACFLLLDGTMAMATYFYPENVIGWWRFITAFNGNRLYGDETQPGGLAQQDNVQQQTNQIMDICKVNTSQGAKLWMIINRIGFPGTQKPGHELLGFEDGVVARMDSFSLRSISGLDGMCIDVDELSDQSVNVVVERLDPNTGIPSYTVHPNVTVLAGVTTVFEQWAWGSNAYIGLFFDNDFQMLSREGGSPRGTAQVTKRRWNKVYARLNKSAKPLIEGVYPKDRTPSTPMGLGEPLITGDVQIVDLGSGEGDLRFVQDRPLQTEITAVFGKLTATEV